MLMFFRELPMDLGHIAHGFGSFTRMRRVVAFFSGERGLDRIVVPRYVSGQLLEQLGVVLMFNCMRSEVRRKLQVIFGALMRSRELGEFRFWQLHGIFLLQY